MHRNAPAWAGWAALTLGVLLILVWTPAIGQFMAVPQSDYSRIPSLAPAEFIKERDIARALKAAPISDDPSDYYRTAIGLQRFDALSERFRLDHPTEWLQAGILPTGATMGDITEIQIRYDKKFGTYEMGATAERMRSWIDEEQKSFSTTPPPGSYSSVLEWLVRGYIGSCLLGALFYMARLKQSELRIWPELCYWRFYAAAALGLVAVFRYPGHIDLKQQIRKTLQFVSGLIAGAISFGAMAGMANARERDGSREGMGNAQEFVLPFVPVPKISVSGGVMSAKVITNGLRVHDGATFWQDAHASFPGGVDVDLWSSQQASGNGSDEIDITVSKTLRFGKTTAVANLAYYDIVPLGKGKGGDILSPFITVERPIGKGLTAFAKADVYFLTHGPPTNNGYDVSVGLKGQTRAGPIQFGHAVSAVYSDGPFGKKAGTQLRFDETASVPVTKRLNLNLNLKLFTPVKGRAADLSGGVGLSYAFN